MSVVNDLLVVLSSYSGGYRLMRARMHGYHGRQKSSLRPSKDVSDAVLRVTLSRLKRKGLVHHEQGIWQITKEGRTYLEKKFKFLSKREHIRLATKRTKNLIVAFDIPESKKGLRDWLRKELVGLGFEKLQKSLWFGTAPLPEEFIVSLHRLELLPHLKFFEAKETDIV